ncbi:MAG: ABC transporter permease [Pseudomonadota bacterium]
MATVEAREDEMRIRRQARRGLAALDLRELWQRRDLLLILAARDVKVRYQQTLLGVTWAVLQPALTLAVFAIFFGRLARVPSDGMPYPLFVLCALVPWQLFSFALTQSSNSLVDSAHMITKVAFPRILVPLASVGAGLVDFLVALALLGLLLTFYGVLPGLRALALIPLTALTLLSALGAGLWLTALNALYRDVRYTIPFLAQFWLLATPVAYPSSLVPEAWRPLYGLNPMAGVVEGFRWALLGHSTAPGQMLALSVLVSALLLTGGVIFFRRVDRTLADVV